MVASRFQHSVGVHKVARDRRARRTTVPRDCGGDSKILLNYIFVKYQMLVLVHPQSVVLQMQQLLITNFTQ